MQNHLFSNTAWGCHVAVPTQPDPAHGHFVDGLQVRPNFEHNHNGPKRPEGLCWRRLHTR